MTAHRVRTVHYCIAYGEMIPVGQAHTGHRRLNIQSTKDFLQGAETSKLFEMTTSRKISDLKHERKEPEVVEKKRTKSSQGHRKWSILPVFELTLR